MNAITLRKSRPSVRLSTALIVLAIAPIAIPAYAQQSPLYNSGASSTDAVPPLIKFSGVLTDINGKPLTGTVGVTFCLYKDSEGGAPLWVETQNVTPDKSGHYTVMLGAVTSTGLPHDLFASGAARWLEVQAQGQSEKRRVMLFSVPYALKAGDAETLGGKPASAFLLAGTTGGPSNNAEASGNKVPGAKSEAIITGGAANYIAGWLTSTTLGTSTIYQSPTTNNIGIGTTSPGVKLDVSGAILGRTGVKGTSSGTAVQGTSSGLTSYGVLGKNTGGGVGVEGVGGLYGVLGTSTSSSAIGVVGQASLAGVSGTGTGPLSTGVSGFGISPSTAGKNFAALEGVRGDSANGYGVLGASDNNYGVLGVSTNTYGVYGVGTNERGVFGVSFGSDGVKGIADSALGSGVAGVSFGGNVGVYGGITGCSAGTQCLAGRFDGNVYVNGELSSNNVAVQATTTTYTQPSSSICFGTPIPNSSCVVLSTSVTSQLSQIFVAANLNGIYLQPTCKLSRYLLVVDGNFVGRSTVLGLSGNSSGNQLTSTTIMALLNLTPGSHSISVQEFDDTSNCPSGTFSSLSGISFDSDSSTIIVREL